jgi:hypothetical protein
MTKNTIHLRLSAEELAAIETVSGGLLPRQTMALFLLRAALRAIEQNGGRVDLPPVFRVVERKTRGV